MKLNKFIEKHTKNLTRYKRETFKIGFSKSGVDQEWVLDFNNGRLLTNQVCTYYNECTYLRTVEKCKTLEDILTFLYTYSFSHTFVRIKVHTNSLERYRHLDILNKIIQLKIDFSKLTGCVYFGSYTISFENGYVSFIRNVPKINDGVFKITGNRDLLKCTNLIVGNLASQYDYLVAVKKLELCD